MLAIPPETVADTVTGMLTTGRTVPAGTGRVPAYVQVTVCAAVPHDQFVPVAVPGTMPEGRVSVRVITLDSAVPPEETTPWAEYVADPPWVNDPDTLSAKATPSRGVPAPVALMTPGSEALAIWTSSDTN